MKILSQEYIDTKNAAKDIWEKKSKTFVVLFKYQNEASWTGMGDLIKRKLKDLGLISAFLLNRKTDYSSDIEISIEYIDLYMSGSWNNLWPGSSPFIFCFKDDLSLKEINDALTNLRSDLGIGAGIPGNINVKYN